MLLSPKIPTPNPGARSPLLFFTPLPSPAPSPLPISVEPKWASPPRESTLTVAGRWVHAAASWRRGVLGLAFLLIGGLGIHAILSERPLQDRFPSSHAVTDAFSSTFRSSRVEPMYTLAVVLDEVPYVDRAPEYLAWTRGARQPGFPPAAWAARDFLPPYPLDQLPSLTSPPKPSESLEVHHFRAPPRKIALPNNAPKLEDLLVMTPAFTGRLNESLLVYEHSWRGKAQCLMSFPPEDKGAIANATTAHAFAERGLSCAAYADDHDDVGERVFEFVKTGTEFARNLTKPPKWFIFADDDTLWLDNRAVRRMLASYDPDEDHIIGARSETKIQIQNMQGMAFGGAGIILSRSLMHKLPLHIEECVADMVDRPWYVHGGDGRISFCAGVVRNQSAWDVVEENPFMHQTDLAGDSTGYLQAGIPAMSLHHTLTGGWTRISQLPNLSPMESTALTMQAARFLGGDVLFSRQVLEAGRVLLVHGRSLTIYETPLQRPELEAAELTMSTDWSEYRFPTRPAIPEGWEQGRARNASWKTTYELSEVRELRRGKAAEMVYRSRAGEGIRVLYVDGQRLR